jgi:hypothetical protein
MSPACRTDGEWPPVQRRGRDVASTRFRGLLDLTWWSAGNLRWMDTLQWIVLVVASMIALPGMVAVAWRELGAPVDPPPGGRVRLTLEVVAPVAGLVALVVWLWVA